MPKKIIIIGSGGHAKVIIDILKSSDNYKIIGCTDASLKQKDIMGLPVLGDDSILPQLYKNGLRHAFVAIGDNKIRSEISDCVKKMGFELINAISPHSYISKSVKLGSGIAIVQGAVINPETVIGNNAIINTGSTIDHDCIIEESCHIAPGCNIAGNVRIGKGTFLGIGCKVIPKITIGEWTTVGAGAVVVNDLPGYSLAVGVPAKIVKEFKCQV
ncbi:MAG: acetyltransferase [Nitrospirota bacterium]